MTVARSHSNSVQQAAQTRATQLARHSEAAACGGQMLRASQPAVAGKTARKTDRATTPAAASGAAMPP